MRWSEPPMQPTYTPLLAVMAYLALTLGSPEALAAPLPQPDDPVTTHAEPRWWKGNLHTHSLWSDGNDYPEMIADWYKEHGYNFLALSDHNVLSDHALWIPTKKAGQPALEKYLARWGEKWVERRTENGEEQVRLKML